MTSPAANVLQVDKVALDLSGRSILRDVSLAMDSGEFLGIIGPNGGGKTTFLRLLVGLLTPTSGKILWQRRDGCAPRIGYVPQKMSLEPHYPLSGIEVVRQGGEGGWPVIGARRRELFARADELIRRVGMTDHARTRVVDMSGGQQRRLLLARALMSRPEMLLLDEPTAGVDAWGQEQFCGILHELSRQGITVVLVSHDIPLITKYADRIACISGNLHWHGAARDLSDSIVHSAYSCELERYQTSHEGEPIAFRKPGGIPHQVHHDHTHKPGETGHRH